MRHDTASLGLRLRFTKGGEAVYGTGVHELLVRTGELRSLHAAARAMGMSYRKALFIVDRAEAGLGEKLVERSAGGAGGGGSSLTAFGADLVRRFRAFEAEAEAELRARAAGRFPEFGL